MLVHVLLSSSFNKNSITKKLPENILTVTLMEHHFHILCFNWDSVSTIISLHEHPFNAINVENHCLIMKYYFRKMQCVCVYCQCAIQPGTHALWNPLTVSCTLFVVILLFLVVVVIVAVGWHSGHIRKIIHWTFPNLNHNIQQMILQQNNYQQHYRKKKHCTLYRWNDSWDAVVFSNSFVCLHVGRSESEWYVCFVAQLL